MNTVALSGSNENGSYRVSYSNLDQKGVMPGGELQRNTVNINTNYKLSERLKSNVALTYVKTEAQNRNVTGYNNANPLQGFTEWWQSQLDVERLREQQNTSEGNQYTWNPVGITTDANGVLQSFNSTPNYFDNPSWNRDNMLQEDIKNRVFGNANLSYDITDNLNISTQFGTDFFQFSIREGIPLRSVDGSRYEETERKFQETNMEVRLNWKNSIGTQKWVALYMNGFQAWNEWRRLDYPQLSAPAAAVMNTIPVRMPYTLSETQSNSSQLEKVTSNPADMTTKVWWDVN